MARKKSKEFQYFFTDYNEWENTLVESKQDKSLLIVDVHSTWCGPCQAIVETFRKIFLEKNEDYSMKFCVLDSEKVLESLEEAHADEHSIRDQYVEVIKPIAGKSQPLFLFFLGGGLRKKISGVNTPIIQKTVQRLLLDIDEGKNTGVEGLLEPDEDEEIESETKPDSKDANSETTSEANDRAFFEDNTTEHAPPSSARSSVSQRSEVPLELIQLSAYVSDDGKSVVFSTDPEAPEGYAPVSDEHASASLGYIPSKNEEEKFTKTLYNFVHNESKKQVLVSQPDSIQEYVQDDAWTDHGLLGFLFDSESTGLVALHDLIKKADDQTEHVYTTSKEHIEKLVADRYEDSVLGYVSTAAQLEQESIASAQPTPRGDDKESKGEDKVEDEKKEDTDEKAKDQDGKKEETPSKEWKDFSQADDDGKEA